jgi:hypothetical protein
MTDKTPTLFGDLAQDMARNHVYLSVRHQDYAWASQCFLKLPEVRTPPKIVVLIGAGASHDACGLPTGSSAAGRLRHAFKAQHNLDSLISAEIHRITVENRLEEHDFETVLLALSKFDQTTVLNELNTIYNRRHYPSLAYEILAHWMKHRFVDAIVNFNFDELLDQALDDELGPHGYYRVITDGDCPEETSKWLDDKGRFKFPVYIKPHGTASSKSTMRFTRRAYTLLSPDLETLLTELFKGRTDVLVVGYAMQSVEFNDILARSGRDKSFFLLDLKEQQLRGGDPKLNSRKVFWDSGSSGGLGPCLEKISGEIDHIFHPDFGPRTISRHRLISKLFKRQLNLDQDRDARRRERETYLRDRVYLEISLAISKGRGFVSLEHLAFGRAGHYFRDLRRYAFAHGSNESIRSMCFKLGLDQFGYWDTVCLPAGHANANRDRLQCPILTGPEFEASARKLAQETINQFSGDRKSIDLAREDFIEELHRAFMEMYDGEEVEVSNDTEATTNDIFASPTPLTTLTSLHAQTKKMLQDDKWDAILCTAESGEWLTSRKWRDEIKKRKAGLALIVADKTRITDLKNQLREQLYSVRWLPWWLHNRHMTVLLHQGKAKGAIYFERRLRTSHIVPLWLEGDDAGIALDAFVAYWIKAAQYEERRSEIEIQTQQIEEERDRLIEDLSRPFGVKRPNTATGT